MSRRSKRRRRKQKQKTQQTTPALIEQGRKAFQQADYDAAIKVWREAQRKPNAPANLNSALAEAHFRRAVSQPDPSPGDLQRASDLLPADSRYRYHLALAYHRLGELDKAEPLYRQLLAESPSFERAAEPLAQLIIVQKQSLFKDPVWEHLSQEAQTQLAAADALVKRKATSTLRQLLDGPLHSLWRGLITLALGDKPAAQEQLQAALASSNGLSALPCGVLHYYLGLSAAQAGQTEQSLKHWQAAQADGFNPPHLRQNLSAVAYQQALAEQQAGRPQQAAELLAQVSHLGADHKELLDFQRQLNWELGYAAAQKGDWAQALDYWEDAETEGQLDRKLLFNLALAYQHTEQYWEAAESWRDLLRRRPRKADHPDALNDEQVARIWQNVAENYSQAGDYEEAVKTYKTAIKWAPDNANLRLKLVEALQVEGRWQAAENELNRILEKEPNNIPALTLLAESYSNDYFPDRAREIWLRILELEPQNPIARQQLAYLYERQGLSMLTWGMHKEALRIFQEGLELVPDSQKLRVLMGGAYADLKDFARARQYFEQALAGNPNDLQTLFTIYTIWLQYRSKRDLDQTLERIKALPASTPSSFFFDLFDHSLQAEESKRAETILKLIEDRYAGDEWALVELALRYVDLDQDARAVSILRGILKDHPKHIDANMQLGTIYYRMGQTRLGKRHWQAAETQARQENDYMRLHQLKMIKDHLMHGRALPTNPFEMLQDMPPDVLEGLLRQAPPEVAELIRNMDPDMLAALMGFDDLDDFYYDDDDDDDDYIYGPGPRRK
jgi:tetratricopeptide (TPR) repeat protein